MSADREEKRARVREWYARNRDAQLAKKKAWRDTNRERALAHSRTWRQQNPEKQDACSKAWRAANKGKIETGYRKYGLARYGLTPAMYGRMLQEQGGLCAGCGETETVVRAGRLLPLSVDHDHVTGEVRGLLCSACNLMIGKKGAAAIRSLAAYAERHQVRVDRVDGSVAQEGHPSLFGEDILDA